MIVATCPTRLSLFGGGTDLPVYSDKYGGIVISMAISLRQRIELNDSGKFEIPEKASMKFYEAFFEEFDYKPKGLKATFDATIESGLGSSASAAVALVGALCKAKGIPMSRREIAEKAWDIEFNKLGLYGGKQDQYAASYGDTSIICFNQSGGIFRSIPSYKSVKMIKNHTMLFYTGSNRKSPKIQEQLRALAPIQESALHDIKRYAGYAKTALEHGNIDKLGGLLDATWELKKQSNNLVTTEKIDEIYEMAKQSGALGGKIMGSGGGGYCFFVVEPQRQKKVRDVLEDLDCKYIDFNICKNGLEVCTL